MYPADLVSAGIYLGSLEAANDHDWLQKHNITHVVGLIDIQEKFPDISYLVFGNVNDSPDQNIVQYFSHCFKFIDNALSKVPSGVSNKRPELLTGNVLVHCHAGISRSTTIVIGYLMYKNKSSLYETYKFVKSKRSIIFPNYGFILQLKVFDRLSHDDKKDWLQSTITL